MRGRQIDHVPGIWESAELTSNDDNVPASHSGS